MARKYSKKASEKVERTMHEFKRGTLKSGSGGKVTSRKQAIAIGLSQARAKGYKVPLTHAVRGIAKQGSDKRSLDDRVRAYLSNMKPSQEIDSYGMARALHDDALGVNYALLRAVKDGVAVTDDERWFGPATSGARGHARRKSEAQLDREIDEALSGRSSQGHATITEGPGSSYSVGGSKFAVEIDPAEFDDHALPRGAKWRDDLSRAAEETLSRGRTYRRPKNARYRAIEWTTYRGELGKLIDWIESTPGITRFAEIFE